MNLCRNMTTDDKTMTEQEQQVFVLHTVNLISVNGKTVDTTVCLYSFIRGQVLKPTGLQAHGHQTVELRNLQSNTWYGNKTTKRKFGELDLSYIARRSLPAAALLRINK